MKVKKFFDLLRQFPNWDVNILIESEHKYLIGVSDVVCDERTENTGELIIVPKKKKKPVDDEVLCEIKWTVADVKKSFKERYGREPTKSELHLCIDEVDWSLVEEKGIENGWTVIDTAVSEALED